MHRVSAAALGLLLCALPSPGQFEGERAMAHTRALVGFGMRPSGSANLARAQRYIVAELKKLNCMVEQQDFTAATPLGPAPMKNIVAKFSGNGPKGIPQPIVAVTGHYDTKRQMHFVGANDGGSSAGFLLEFARSIAAQHRKHDVYLIWFDGEEAVKEWSATDSLYGSRHAVEVFRKDGRLGRIKALINVDMIGDRDLRIVNEYNSTKRLRDLIWQTATARGYGAYFDREPAAIEDDHMPFIKAGVAAVDLIDFSYGPVNSYWHTAQDTLDKLSPKSFQVIGDVLLAVLDKL